MIHQLNRLLAPLMRRIRLLINRAVVTRSDSSRMMQTLQVGVLSQETLDLIEHFEPYGFTSRPQQDAEALIASIGGRRSNAVCFMVSDRRFRVRNLAEGEVALFTDEGDVIHFQRDNKIMINTGNEITVVAANSAVVTAPVVTVNASSQVSINSPVVNMTGVLNVTGNINSGAEISDANGTMQNMRDIYNGHTHPSGGVPNPQM